MTADSNNGDNRNDIDGDNCISFEYERSCASHNVRCASSAARLCLDVRANAVPTGSIVKSMLMMMLIYRSCSGVTMVNSNSSSSSSSSITGGDDDYDDDDE